MQLRAVKRWAIGLAASVIVVTTYLSFLLSTNLFYEAYARFYDLTPGNTVADFRAAAPEFRTRWLDAMCTRDGCLHRLDRQCGFVSSDNDEDDDNVDPVLDCFTSLALDKAPLSDTLQKLRLICGRRHMKFTGTYSDVKTCTGAGGKWGEKARLFDNEDSYKPDD